MPAEIPNQEKAFELKTVRQDLAADILFLIGTLISMNQNIESEEKILNPVVNPTNNTPTGLGTLPLQLFLAATIVLAFSTAEKLCKQKAETGNNIDQTTANNIKGDEIVILGQLLRIIGYIISLAGQNIKAANPV